MPIEDHLTLKLIRLKPLELWAGHEQQLSIIFLKEGAAEYTTKTSKQRLAPGDLIVLSNGAGGRISNADGNETVFCAFSLAIEHLFPLLAVNEICHLKEVVVALRSAKYYPASTALAAKCQGLFQLVPPRFNFDHRSQMLRIAAAILSVEFDNVQTQKRGTLRAEEHLIQVFKKLTLDELLQSSVDELAGRFGCCRRHLNRLFRQHFGISVAAVKMEMRLLKAVSLLRDSDSKVIHVAENCGFNHLGLFNTCFKKRFGASPGQWRKSELPVASRSADLAKAFQLLKSGPKVSVAQLAKISGIPGFKGSGIYPANVLHLPEQLPPGVTHRAVSASWGSVSPQPTGQQNALFSESVRAIESRH